MFRHTGLGVTYLGSIGSWGVSVFFILSGFVSVYSQIDDTEFSPSISSNFKYAIRRIKKLYPLHMVTTFIIIPFLLYGTAKISLPRVLLQLGLNVTFLQEWLPFENRSINGVSWFLCTIVLFYFLFPWILKKIQNDCSNEKAKRTIAICMLAETIITIVSFFLPRPMYSPNMIFAYYIVEWFTYYFPLSRIFDCLIGCYLGYLYLCDEKNISNSTMKEVITFVACSISIVISSIARPITLMTSDIPIISYTNGWSYALIFLPGTIPVVYLFAHGEGKISNFFTKPVFMYLAKLSKFGFLIHQVVFRYLNAVARYIVFSGNENLVNQYSGWIKLIIGIPISLFASQVWIWLTNWISSRKPSPSISLRK